VDIALAARADSARRIAILLALQRRWGRAHTLGPLGTVRKAKVLEAFEHQIARMACGVNWADTARECHTRKPGLLDRLQREVGGSPGFASRMRNTQWNQVTLTPRAREEFLKIAKIYDVSANDKLCELALRLAFQPSTIRLADLNKMLAAFEELAGNPILARGAYLAKLSTDLAIRDCGASIEGGAS
jgi:hypothetical protein